MELKFDLCGRWYLPVSKLLTLEESIGWLTNASSEMAENAYNMVFVTDDGHVHPENQNIINLIKKTGEAKRDRDALLNRLK